MPTHGTTGIGDRHSRGYISFFNDRRVVRFQTSRRFSNYAFNVTSPFNT
jgi:hypothetical protein